MSIVNLTESQIVKRLKSNRNTKLNNPYPDYYFPQAPSPAAVLIPLLQQNDSWHILFIRRTTVDGDPHSGQVAFPGGRCDPHDPNPETAALRETYEEIGLLPEDVRILGKLQDFMTITNYQVTPIVGVISWPYKLDLSHDEVDRAFTIPLVWLFDPRNRETRLRELPGNLPPLNVIYFKSYSNEVLWGASARIVVNFLSTLTEN
jgi:8-oxo-dGTP pyrophosphatase MutT (NUDIX family)